MTDGDASADVLEQVRVAVDNRQPVAIRGGGSQPLGSDCKGDPVSLLSHHGVINHAPTELVISVRAGTLIDDVSDLLSEHRQMLPFEPPRRRGSTIGGVIACGLSGPRRPWFGSARDHVLGMRLVNGRAEALSFGGEVMKNVAGYDVSRLQVGAFGTLGVLLDISLKVLPQPEVEATLCHELDQPDDVSTLIRLAREPLPITASLVLGRTQYLRLGGRAVAVESSARRLGGERLDDADAFWRSIRDGSHAFLSNPTRPLWRVGVAAHAPAIEVPGDWLMDWGGAQRWLQSDAEPAAIFAAARAVGGHATRYARLPAGESGFQPLEGPMRALQSRLRDSFDPHRLLNRGVFHAELDHADGVGVAPARFG